MLTRQIGRQRQRTPRGFTLVELLVVIAIIGILIALLLPAVQAAREAARRTTCTNNLKQLSLGMLQHEDVHKTLPHGGWCWYWVGDPDQGYGKAQPGSWNYNILEYIEQGNLRQLGAGGNVLDKRKALGQMIAAPIPAFICPSRRSSAAASFVATDFYVNALTDQMVSKTDYAASGGSISRPGTSFVFAPSAGTAAGVFKVLEAGSSSSKWPTEFSDVCNGATCIAKSIRMSEITDGMSNTILLGEKYVDASRYDTGDDGGDNNASMVGYDWDNIRFAEEILAQDRPGAQYPYRFGSNHPAGAAFAFGDGSVHWIMWTVDLKAYKRLAMRSDGEVASSDSFQ